MPDLTLDQVREAGRFAWNEYHAFVFADGVFIEGTPDDSYRRDDCTEGTIAVLRRDGNYVDIWRHLPGCDCEFCA